MGWVGWRGWRNVRRVLNSANRKIEIRRYCLNISRNLVITFRLILLVLT
jgi:hypothetical protein